MSNKHGGHNSYDNDYQIESSLGSEVILDNPPTVKKNQGSDDGVLHNTSPNFTNNQNTQKIIDKLPFGDILIGN